MTSFDVIIRNGKVMDGNCTPWFRADIGIEGERIASVGRLDGHSADTVIDAKGLVVSPGFIDIHNHSDTPLVVSGRAESMVMQGVTTVLTCSCGTSPFPLSGEALREAKNRSVRYGLDIDWTDVAGYEARLRRQGISINTCLQIGHGTLRASVMGYEARAPTGNELSEMKAFVEEAMEMGCFGMSTGLGYSPGMFAETSEVIELCKVVAKHNGLYSTHIRRGFPRNLEEALEIGEKAGLPVQMSHIGSSTGGRDNWGKARAGTLNMVDAARARGIDFTADIYPYIASSTGLASTLPQWIHAGGTKELLRRISEPETRARIKRELGARDWTQTLLVWFPSRQNKRFEGKTLQQIAQEKGADPVDAMFDLLLEEKGQISYIGFFGLEEDIKTLMKHEAVMIGSDGSALEPTGVLGEGKNHPRNYGTFVRVLQKYVGEGVLSLAEAVHKMSGMPAWRLGLYDRGTITPGAYADITIFNPWLIKEKGTWTDPYQFPEGISHVLVNGVTVVQDGKHLGTRPGKVLHRPVG